MAKGTKKLKSSNATIVQQQIELDGRERKSNQLEAENEEHLKSIDRPQKLLKESKAYHTELLAENDNITNAMTANNIARGQVDLIKL